VKKAAKRDKSGRSKKLAAFYVAQGQEKPEKLRKVKKSGMHIYR